MSPRKIIFIAVAGVVLLLGVFFLWKISQNANAKKVQKVDTLTVWVVWDTSAQYENIFSGFWAYNKEYSKTKFEIKVFPEYSQYKKVLLSTLADNKWPDIFVIEAWADDILAGKVVPIPSDIIDIKDFDKKYEDIFLPLITTEWEKESKKEYLQWVPLGYETLGIFYNKSLLRSVPKTWNEVDTMYSDGTLPDTLVTNIGMGPRYTPYATDIIAYFLTRDTISDYLKMASGKSGISDYIAYAYTSSSQNRKDTDWPVDSYSGASDLKSIQAEMDREKLSTIDLFMRGRIAFVVGYPSLIWEIEKAYKRAWTNAVDALILTDRIPWESLGKEKQNLARYQYLGISKKSPNALAAAKLLEYLMRDWSQKTIQEQFPLLISPLRSYYDSIGATPLSRVFAKAKLAPFIPESWEKLVVFHYGLKEEFEKIFAQDIDRNEKIDNNNLLTQISAAVQCELETMQKGTLSESCQKKQ